MLDYSAESCFNGAYAVRLFLTYRLGEDPATMVRSYVTIVSGLPRSGTSMMMRMLGEGGIDVLTDRVRLADEDNPNGYYEFEPVKKTGQDPTWIAGAIGKVVKMVHLLLLDLPPGCAYRVVFMRRDLGEVIRSQDRMLERLGRSSGDIPPERLAALYRAQIDKVFGHLRSRADQCRVLEVDYNALMGDARPILCELSDFLDGLDIEGMSRAIDTKLYRVRKPTASARLPQEAAS